MWPKQSRKSPHETSNSPLPQPVWKKISYAYSGSPDSPCIRRSIPRISNSDDIKRNLSNITDDDYDMGYSAPASLANFSSINPHTKFTNIISSSPCNSVDSGFQSPTGLQSPLSGSLPFNLSSQLSSSSSPLYVLVRDGNQLTEENVWKLLVSPNEAIAVDPDLTTPSPVPGSGRTTATECRASTKCPQLTFTTPLQDKNQRPSDVCLNLLSTPSENPGASSVKIIYLNSLEHPSSSPSAAILDRASLLSPPSVSRDRSPPKDVVIEIIKSEECQTPKLLKNLKNEAASCPQTPNNDQPFGKRPSHSYEKLIKAALNSRPDKRMTLKEIRQWVEDAHPFYKNSPNPGWKDSIRHNLSVSKLFVKESPKYGSYWKLATGFREPATSPQVPSGVKCETRLSNTNSPVPAIHVFNTVNTFPMQNAHLQPQAIVPRVRQKVKLKKKGPLPILPRLNVDPQTYVLVPLQYFCSPVQNNIPIMPQLPSTPTTSGSSSFIAGSHVIAQSTSTRLPVTSTPISTSRAIDFSTKDLLAYHQSPVLSPLAINQISSPNPSGQTLAKTPVLQNTVPPYRGVRTPDRSKQLFPKRIIAKSTPETKSKLQESPFLEQSVRRQKLSSDRKSRRKQKLVCKDMSPMDSSRSDVEIALSRSNVEIASPEKDRILSPLPQTPTNNINTFSSVKTSTPSGRAIRVASPTQIFLPAQKASLVNSLLQTPPSSQKLMLGSFEMSPNSVGLDASLKDGNLSVNLSDSISQVDELEIWDLLNYS